MIRKGMGTVNCAASISGEDAPPHLSLMMVIYHMCPNQWHRHSTPPPRWMPHNGPCDIQWPPPPPCFVMMKMHVCLTMMIVVLMVTYHMILYCFIIVQGRKLILKNIHKWSFTHHERIQCFILFWPLWGSSEKKFYTPHKVLSLWG